MASLADGVPPLPLETRGAPKTRRPRQSKPAAIERWERDYKCVQMRRAEHDWQSIVDTLGYASPGHAHNAYVRFMQAYPRGDVELMRDLELDKIEKTCRELEKVIASGTKEAVRAAEVWTKLSERRSRMMGWDKPERRELTVLSKDKVAEAIEKLNVELAAKAREHDVDLTELEVD